MTKLKIHEKVKAVSDHLAVVVAIITSLTAIGGAGIAACNWVVNTVSAQSNQRIDQLQDDMKQHQQTQEQAITRLELMTLIQNDPYNKVEIEKLARHYFIDLSGNAYMSGVYSKWCEQYGGDISIAVRK